MCGEKDITALNANNWQGSPPRMRGKGLCRERHCLWAGITPACAGKRQTSCWHGSAVQDYPRMCGEKSLFELIAGLSTGLPPHVRGKAIRNHFKEPVKRITPACAGKRGRGTAQDLTDRDHPRVCGEKLLTLMSTTPFSGSPPRMRGKVRQAMELDGVKRITPAYAGKRNQSIFPAGRKSDHPRVCGEKDWRRN